MARIELIEAGEQLGVKIDTTLAFYNRIDLSVSAEDAIVTLLDTTTNETVVTAHTTDFISPQEASVKDLLILIHGLLITVPVLELTLNELQAIQNADNPSGANPFITESAVLLISNTASILGGIAGIGINVTNTCSYGNNAAIEPPTANSNGEITALSISLTTALTQGTCEAQITINGVAQTGVGETVLLAFGGSDQHDSLVLASPIAYNAGDRIGLQSVTIGAGPTGADATLMLTTKNA